MDEESVLDLCNVRAFTIGFALIQIIILYDKVLFGNNFDKYFAINPFDVLMPLGLIICTFLLNRVIKLEITLKPQS